jgi:hypothetical protein
MTLALDGYTYDERDFALLVIRKHYPERTDGESHVIRAFLLEHLRDFDRITFSKRVGHGITPLPDTLQAVQQNTVFSSKLRIDILAWRGNLPIIVEVKQDVTPASLGQILTYRHHFVEEFPEAPEPELVVVGRTASPDAIAALQAHSVTVYLYPDATTGKDDGIGGV